MDTIIKTRKKPTPVTFCSFKRWVQPCFFINSVWKKFIQAIFTTLFFVLTPIVMIYSNTISAYIDRARDTKLNYIIGKPSYCLTANKKISSSLILLYIIYCYFGGIDWVPLPRNQKVSPREPSIYSMPSMPSISIICVISWDRCLLYWTYHQGESHSIILTIYLNR